MLVLIKVNVLNYKTVKIHKYVQVLVAENLSFHNVRLLDDFMRAVTVVSQWLHIGSNCKAAHRACVIFMKATNNADFVVE